MPSYITLPHRFRPIFKDMELLGGKVEGRPALFMLLAVVEPSGNHGY